ncbi:MAG: MFS transporter [Acidimicrobiia bacterium]|nr:MFS transporter [Acidimicrobiia bacterium]
MPVLAGAVAVAMLFAATPFLIPEVADRFDVSVGTAGLLSVAQVASFAATTFILPRLAAPSVRIFLIAAGVLAVGNGVSALLTAFPLLVGVRAVAGGAAGALIWMAWSDAMQAPRSLAAISAAAPLTVLLSSPLIAALSAHGDRAIYAALAIASAPLLLMRPSVTVGARPTRHVSRSRSNRVLLGALVLMTFAGASLFIYESVAARQQLGLTPLATSLGFSLNAAGGLLGARLSGRHRRPGLWLASAGPAAALSIAGGHAIFFFIGIGWWGFAFWMGVPGVMQMLSARSLHPAERAGDAQSAMAVGRALAPLLGGAFADADAYTTLALVSGAGLTVAGLSIAGVQEGRDRLPPSDPIFHMPKD